MSILCYENGLYNAFENKSALNNSLLNLTQRFSLAATAVPEKKPKNIIISSLGVTSLF